MSSLHQVLTTLIGGCIGMGIASLVFKLARERLVPAGGAVFAAAFAHPIYDQFLAGAKYPWLVLALLSGTLAAIGGGVGILIARRLSRVE